MIPKVEACLTSLEAGVKKTHIIDGRLRHSLLLEIYTDTGIGTEIVLQDRTPTAGPRPPRRLAVLSRRRSIPLTHADSDWIDVADALSVSRHPPDRILDRPA